MFPEQAMKWVVAGSEPVGEEYHCPQKQWNSPMAVSIVTMKEKIYS